MKRGALHFLGKKNHSLFDTNIKIKDMENVDVPVLQSPTILESGTASVRARPTVKHHTSTSDSFQGFAVPTPKVPLLPPVNGPKINGSVGGHHLSNGSVTSIPDLEEGEIFVPPPPSTAPPPPPSFIPPPDFMGDLNSLQSPSLTPFMDHEEDFTYMKPPPMAPPKPPSTCSSGSVPISSPSPAKLPERPAFAPPQPPSERQHKAQKKPPPKPIRLSSISINDSPPQTPAPPPPAQTPTLSTFNPQHTAKIYNVPQTSILSGYEEHDTRPKQRLLLQDSASGDSAPVLVQVDGKTPKVATPPKPVDGKTPKVATPSKPVLKDVHELKENLQIQPSQSPLPEPNKEAKTTIISAQPELNKPPLTQHQKSPHLQTRNSTQVNSEPIKDKLEGSPSQGRKFSPLIDRKLRNLKNSETNGARDGPAASPLALLMAAKERDKHRSNHSLSRENSAKGNEQPSASIHPSDSSPNSFVVTPRSSSSSSLTSLERIQGVSPAVQTQTIQTPEKDTKLSTSSVLSRMVASTKATNLAEQKHNAVQIPSKPQPTQPEELNIPFLPPPPEFGDFDEFMEPPPSMPPPDPPMKKAPTPMVVPPPPTMAPLPPTVVPPPPTTAPPPPIVVPPPPTTAPPPPAVVPPPPTAAPLPPSHIPPPPPKPQPPAAPKLPPPDIDVKPKLQPQTKPKPAPPQLPPNLSPSQATLLSILQKKMLEMDHKMAPAKEAESSSDDWGVSLPEEDYKVPASPRASPQSKSYPVVNKAATLNMNELEGKVAKKYKESTSVKVPTSNGTQSKHQYGMTFTVRPGTKQPITLVRKGEP
ncbi:uncharacterized protein LOC131962335 [Centropristis striata]|uniref:uncharacterized protein LOC131962335 n=1 Tax=Centropristis striata TaxID=184440 RepID=UPI0027E0F241|nr:uncharacterized protein LOC131962335 [Centropristis striata]